VVNHVNNLLLLPGKRHLNRRFDFPSFISAPQNPKKTARLLSPRSLIDLKLCSREAIINSPQPINKFLLTTTTLNLINIISGVIKFWRDYYLVTGDYK